MHLLKVGRSLGEARYRPHRYKLVNPAMPVFGPVGGARVEPDCDSLDPGTDGPEAGMAEINADYGGQTMKTDAAEPMATAPMTIGRPAGRWALKANPFKSSKKPASRVAVQGELSLDKVKVVRNDLSDSDLELVVASRPKPVVEPDPDGIVASNATPKKPSLLARVKARFRRVRTH